MEEDIARLAGALSQVSNTVAKELQRLHGYTNCWYCSRSTEPDPYNYDVYEGHAPDCPIAIAEQLGEKYGCSLLQK